MYQATGAATMTVTESKGLKKGSLFNAHIGHPVSPTILKTPYSSPFRAIMQARKSASKIVACSRFSNLNLVLGKLANIRE